MSGWKRINIICIWKFKGIENNENFERDEKLNSWRRLTGVLCLEENCLKGDQSLRKLIEYECKSAKSSRK